MNIIRDFEYKLSINPFGSHTKMFPQSDGAEEYTDCTSAEDKTPPPVSVLDMTLNNLMVRF